MTKRSDKPTCPSCGATLVVEPRGSDHIAYCPGNDTAEWNTGCYAEFGEDAKAAVAKVNYEHDCKTI